LKKTKSEILQFLKFFVENASNKILPYAVELKSVLLTIFNVDSASDVRAAIFPVLSQVKFHSFLIDFCINLRILVNGIKCWFSGYGK
jgi:hypothetical protein